MSLRYTLVPTKTAQEKIQPVEKNNFDLSKWFGDDIRCILDQVETSLFNGIEEIRIRIGKPLLLQGNYKEYFINSKGAVVHPEKAYRIRREDLLQTLERMTQSSLYAAEEEMKQGFLTLPGGHRVGITGEALLKNGEIQILKHISALNVRISREVEGRAAKLIPMLLRSNGTLYHTLILSPPQAGKTTLLRDLIRNLSNGNTALNLSGQTIGVVDERGELAGMWQGVPSYNLGLRTDVLDGCPKWIGMSMLVRSMAPRIVAVDEIGHPQDAEAVREAIRMGVSVLSTAHAGYLEEAIERPSLKGLFKDEVFERIVLLSRRQGPGTIESVFDFKNQREMLNSGGRNR